MTRIGNLLGEKNARRAGVASNTSIMMAFTVGCIWRYVRFLYISVAPYKMAMIEANTLTMFHCILFCLKQYDVHCVSALMGVSIQ